MNKILLSIPLAVLAGLAALGCRSTSPTKRQLNELGSIVLPARLDPYRAIERDTFALFPFDRTANSILLIGSNRPIPEKLVVAVWTPASRQAAREAAIKEAQDRTSEIAWRKDGDYDVGEGMHEVNTAKNPAWVVVREFEDRHLTIAYMVWKKAGSLEQAQRIVEATYRSFQPARTPEAYLAIARERPAKQRQARRQALDEALAARGVRLALDDGAPIRKSNVWYLLYTDNHRGTVFLALHSLGSRQRPAASDPPPRVIPPPGIPNWPTVVWLEKKGQKWQSHGIDGDPDLPEKLKQHVGAGHTGAAADLAHFYTLHWAIMDDPEMPAPDLDAFEGESVRMAALFREGKLIE